MMSEDTRTCISCAKQFRPRTWNQKKCDTCRGGTALTTRDAKLQQAAYAVSATAIRTSEERGSDPPTNAQASLLRRMGDLLDDVAGGDFDQLEMVCSEIASQDGSKFTAWFSLSPIRFEWVRDEMDIPEGAWSFARWEKELPPGTLKDSLSYWIGYWSDSVSGWNPEGVERAKKNLQLLRDEADAQMLGL